MEFDGGIAAFIVVAALGGILYVRWSYRRLMSQDEDELRAASLTRGRGDAAADADPARRRSAAAGRRKRDGSA